MQNGYESSAFVFRVQKRFENNNSGRRDDKTGVLFPVLGVRPVSDGTRVL